MLTEVFPKHHTINLSWGSYYLVSWTSKKTSLKIALNQGLTVLQKYVHNIVCTAWRLLLCTHRNWNFWRLGSWRSQIDKRNRKKLKEVTGTRRWTKIYILFDPKDFNGHHQKGENSSCQEHNFTFFFYRKSSHSADSYSAFLSILRFGFILYSIE